MPKIVEKTLYNTVVTAATNTTVSSVDVPSPAQWIQVIAIATTPNAGATLAISASPTGTTDNVVLRDQNGVAITLDLNAPNFIKLGDLSIDKLTFTPSGLTAGGYKVVVDSIYEFMGKEAKEVSF